MPINTTSTPHFEKPKEGVEDTSPSLELDLKDDELIKTIDALVKESSGTKADMDKRGRENELYWKGNQLNEQKMRPHQSKIVDNRLFMSLETIIPIMTSRTPEPTIRMKDDQLKEDTKQLLMNMWEVPTDKCDTEGMQYNVEMISRHWAIYLIGILKYEYNPEIDDIETTWKKPDKMIFDKNARKFSESRFVGEWCDSTAEKLIELFPDKKDKIEASVGKNNLMSVIKYIEFWTPKYVVYKYNNILLKKMKNPNWDYGDMNESGEPMFNLYPEKKMPFIPLTVFNIGNTVYDDTSLMEQGKSIQDGVNKRKNQINDNANDNGVLVGSGDFIEKKTLESYTGDPNEKLFIKSGSAAEAVNRIPPKQLPAFVFSDLQDSKSEIDNMFGAHSTTRGEQTGQKTLGEAKLLKSGDLGRIDLFSRALDRVAQEWYTAMLHMYLIYKTEPVEVNTNDEDNTSIIFDRNNFIDPETGKLASIKVKVKPGSAMSIDKDTRRAEAVQLMTAGLIDPISFYERMDYANPKEMAMKLFIWQTNPIALFPEMMEEQQHAQIEQTGNVPLPEGIQLNLPGGGETPPVTQ